MVILLMGVSGAGKTTVGEGLAKRHGIPFVDGDDLHPADNVRKMAAGEALTDEDRRPWLLAIRRAISEHAERGEPAVIACSALKQGYRRLLLEGLPQVRLVYLRGEPALLERRLAGRKGHFFDPRLLVSQLEILEEPAEALIADVDASIEEVIDAVEAAVGLAST